MINPRSGVSMVTRAPDWNVVLFNNLSQTFYEMTAEQWAREMVVSHGYEEWSQGSHWTKSGTVTICGIKGSLYTIHGQMRKRDSNGNIMSADVPIVGAKYIVAEQYPLSPKLAHMMKDVFDFPPWPVCLCA